MLNMVQITTGLKVLVYGGSRYDFFHDMTGLCKLDLGPWLNIFSHFDKKNGSQLVECAM